jgi:hypothetical protein
VLSAAAVRARLQAARVAAPLNKLSSAPLPTITQAHSANGDN